MTLRFPALPVGLPLNGKSVLVMLATLTFLLVWWFPFSPGNLGLKSYPPLHTALEIFAVVVAGSIFIIGWNGRDIRGTPHLAIIAGSFLGVALLDVAHLLSFTGMPDWVTPSGGGKAIYFWFAARFLAAFALLALVLQSGQLTVRRGAEWLMLAGVLGLVAMVCWMVLWHVSWLPVFFVEGSGLTPAKVLLEWLLVALALVTLILTRIPREQPEYYGRRHLTAALWLTMLSELCFTLYSNSVDVFNVLGHVYKVLSYGCLYQAIVVGAVKLPHRLLSESREILQQLTDNIRQVFWMSSVDKQQMLFVSPAYETIWGRSCRSLMESPKSWLDAIHPEDRERVAQALPSQPDGSYSMEYRIVHPDGSERWIRDTAFPIRNEQGGVLRIAGVADDFTERKLAKEALRDSSERIRGILDTVLDAIITIDERGTIESFNPAAERLFEYRAGEVIGRNVNVLMPEPYHAAHDGYLAHYLATGERRIIGTGREVQGRRKNGTTFPLELAVNEMRLGGQRKFVGSVHDITERKQAEAQREGLQAQLVQSQKMEAIGHLTGGIAHDFNNMLGAMLGYAELLKQLNATPAAAPKQGKYVDEILTAGNRAKELIAQMMAFSRRSPQSRDDAAPATRLQPVVKEVVRLLRASIPSSIEVDYRLEDDTLKTRAQPVQLHQILLNLAINARDAIGEYGRIDITVGKRVVTGICDSCHESFSGEYVVLGVQDTGKGIPAHIRPRMFDPFFTTKDVGKGSGMGLSVVHGVVHAHAGHITVASETGTTMRICLPPAATDTEGAALPAHAIDAAGSDLSGVRVVVVDDESSMVSMLAELLEMHGARVATYTHPTEALAAFEREPHSMDLVITDATMTELSGLDLASAMLSRRPALPIILCTGYSERVTPDIAQQHGIASFMHKPVQTQQLVDTAARLARRGT